MEEGPLPYRDPGIYLLPAAIGHHTLGWGGVEERRRWAEGSIKLVVHLLLLPLETTAKGEGVIKLIAPLSRPFHCVLAVHFLADCLAKLAWSSIRQLI